MVEVMQIDDILEISNKGFAFVGGNTKIDIENSVQIKDLVGKEVIVKSFDDEELNFKVTDVSISFSIGGHLLIGIYIGYPTNISKVKKGSTIYSKNINLA